MILRLCFMIALSGVVRIAGLRTGRPAGTGMSAATRLHPRNMATSDAPDATFAEDNDPFTLTFREKSTGVVVKLIGAMHYNPVSIQTSNSICKTLAENDSLQAVVVESCESRWEKMQSRQPRDTLIRALLDNEMQVSAAPECAFIE